MSTVYTAATRFTAIDKFSAVVDKMARSTSTFADNSVRSLARVERADRRMRASISNSIGKLGELGLAISGIAVVNEIATANLDAEKSFASLSAVTGVSGKAFEKFKEQGVAAAKETKMFVGDMAKAMELISSQKPELLANAEAMAMVTKSAVVLSRASRDTLDASAENLTGIMNQFSLGYKESNRTINTLAAGTIAGAASITDVALSLKNVGSVAHSANMSLEQTVAVLQIMSLKKLKSEEAGTKLRGVILKLQEAGVGYASGSFKVVDAISEVNNKLLKISSAKEKDAFLTKIFGIENRNAGDIILKSASKIDSMTQSVSNTSAAHEMAAKNMNTMSFRLESLKNKFKNYITITDESSTSLRIINSVIKFVDDNLGAILVTVGSLIASYVAFRAILLLSRITLIAYNVVLGISTALSGASAFAVHGNTVAYAAFRAVVVTMTYAMKLFTAAQWLLNVALTANPIGLVIVAVAALIALVVLAVKYWKDWGAALAVFLGPIGFVISAVQSFRRNWEMVKTAFSTGGIMEGIKAIGRVLLDALIMPVQQLLKLLAKIPGLGGLANTGVMKMQEMRDKLGVNTTTDESGKPLNPTAAANEVQTQRMEKTVNQKLEVSVKAEAGTSASVGGSKDISPKVTNTVGWQSVMR